MTDGARCTSRIYYVDFESWLISFMNCSLWSGLLFRASYWKWNLSQLNNRNWNKKADIPPFTWMHSFWTFFCNLLHIYSGVDLNLLDCHVIVQVHKFIIFISISRDGDFFWSCIADRCECLTRLSEWFMVSTVKSGTDFYGLENWTIFNSTESVWGFICCQCCLCAVTNFQLDLDSI